eukprot:EG_transcript_7831
MYEERRSKSYQSSPVMRLDIHRYSRSVSFSEGCRIVVGAAGPINYGTYSDVCTGWAEGIPVALDAEADGFLCCPVPASCMRLHTCNLIMLSVFIALYCDYALNSMGVPILPAFLRNLDIAHKYIGFLFASKPAVQVLGNALAGPLVGRCGAEQTLLLGLGVLALSTAVFGVGLSVVLDPGTTYGLLLAARGVQGLSSAFIMAAGMTWIAQTHTPGRRGMAMSVVLVGIGAGAMSGASFAGFLAVWLGNAGPFYIMACLLVLNVLIILSVQADPVVPEEEEKAEDPGSPQKSELAKLFKLCRKPDVLCINCLVFTGNFGMTVLQPTLPLYLSRSLGYTQQGQGLMWGVMALVYLLARPASGWLAARCMKWRVIGLGLGALSAGLFLTGAAHNAGVIGLGISLVGLGVAFVTTPCMPLMADVIELYGSRQYGVFYSMVDVCTSLGMIGGPLLGSLLREQLDSFEWTFRIIGLSVLPALLCCLSLRTVEALVQQSHDAPM